MQPLPIHEVWIQSWSTQDLIGFGTLAVVALVVLAYWARKRARAGESDAGLGL